ncbi:MAG TPA: hypothetical protein VGN17_30320 [Bryobacteraceae bacterium]
MDLTHFHLLLNHFPTIGTIIGLGLFLMALLGKSNELKEASLVVFLGIALLTIPTYITGNAAEEKICGPIPPNAPAAAACTVPGGASKAMIGEHETAAMYALGFMEITGAFAWLGIWQLRRRSHLPAWNAAVILGLSLFTFAVVAKAANLGGEIRHPEIRASQPYSGFPASTQTSAQPVPLSRQVGSFIVSTKWVWPTCETLHFIGLSLLFGVAALIDLRMLGMFTSIPYRALHRLLPWGILGFGLNAITGMIFFIGAPGQYTTNPAFHWKMIMMLLAGINVVYFTLFDEPWDLKAGDKAPLLAKAVAATALFLVLGVLYCGRMLPFLGTAF